MPSQCPQAPANTAAKEAMKMSWAFIVEHTPFRLEPDVLKSLGGHAIQTRGGAVLAAPRRQIALRHPRRGAVAGRRKLVEARLGGRELRLRLLEPVLLEQRAPEHELRVADLVEQVDAGVEQLERVPRLLLREHGVAGAEVHL